MTELTEFEREVLARSLEGESAESAALRAQLIDARVRTRTMSGVGFSLSLEVAPGAPRLGIPQQIHFGNVVIAPRTGLRFGAGFLVTVADGALREFEGYSFGEPWPSRTDGLDLDVASGLATLDAVVAKARTSSPVE